MIEKRPVWINNDNVSGFEVVQPSGKDSPLVSVIVPVYNMLEKGFLPDLVASLRSQTLDAIEFVLVDDCSSDGSLEWLCSSCAGDSRFALVKSFQNGRQGAARNKGLAVAKGRYIGFVDADDAVDPAYFEVLAQTMQSCNVDIAIAPFKNADSKLASVSSPIWPFERPGDEACVIDDMSLLIMHPTHVFAALYSADLFREGCTRFPEGVYFEDNPTCLRLLCQAGKVAMVPVGEKTPAYYYRQHEMSTDHRTDNLSIQIRDRIATSDLMLDDAKESGYYEANHDAINLYYFQLCFVNTITKYVAIANYIDSGVPTIADLKDHVSKRIGLLKENSVFRALPWRRRLKLTLFWVFPGLYLSYLNHKARA